LEIILVCSRVYFLLIKNRLTNHCTGPKINCYFRTPCSLAALSPPRLSKTTVNFGPVISALGNFSKCNSSMKINFTFSYDFTAFIHTWLIASRGRLMLYRYLAWTAFFGYISLVYFFSCLCAFMLNNSLIHLKENDFKNIISSFIAIVVITSPLTLLLLNCIYIYTIKAPRDLLSVVYVEPVILRQV